MEKGLSPNIHNDLNWLESEVEGRQCLVGNDVTAADILMGFSIEFIFARKLGTEGGDWPNVKKWLEGLQQREAYTKAVGREDWIFSVKEMNVYSFGGVSKRCLSLCRC